jgi:hypothetical protein
MALAFVDRAIPVSWYALWVLSVPDLHDVYAEFEFQSGRGWSGMRINSPSPVAAVQSVARLDPFQAVADEFYED